MARIRKFLYAGVSSVGLLAGTAQAQEAATQVEDIIVTAQKRTERLVEVPVAIQVLAGSDLRERGVTDFLELSNQVPGLALRQSVAGRSTQALVIRGVGADDFRPNGNPSAALHVDGVYQGSNIFFSNQFFDLARIEVLKGPQGTLYGRNSSTGVVNLITNRPSEVASGFVELEYSSFNTINLEAAVGGMIDDRVGVRLAVLHEDGDGYFQHQGTAGFEGFRLDPRIPTLPRQAPVDDFGGPNFTALRGTVTYSPADGTDVTVQVQGARDRSDLNITDVPLGSPARNPIDNDPFTVASNLVPQLNADTAGAYVQLDQAIGTATLTIQASHQTVDQTAANSDGTPLRLIDVTYETALTQTTYEARLASETSGRFDWLVGAFYLTDKVDFDSVLLALDNPGFRTNLFTQYQQDRDSLAAFGQVGVALTPALELIAGLRYTDETVVFDGITGDLNPFGTTLRSDSFPLLFENRFEDQNWSGRGALTYRPSDDSSLYVAVARGFKAGGFDGSTLFTPPENDPIGSETVWSYEAGFKWLPRNGALAFTADVFFSEYKGLQGNREVDFKGTPVLVRVNLAGAEVYGAELSGSARLAEGLEATLGAAFLRTEITEVNTPSAALRNRLLGNDLPDAPEVSLNAALRYERSLGALQLEAQVDAAYKSEMFKEEENLVAVPDYTLVNARVGLTNQTAGWGLAAFARHVTDAEYFTSYQPQGRAVRQRLVAPPRTVGVELTFRY